MKKKKSKSAAKRKSPLKAKVRTKSAPRVKARKAKKSPSKKPAKARSKRTTAKAPEARPKPTVIAPLNSELLGYVEDYFAKIGVIAVTLQRRLSVGDRLHVLGFTTDFKLAVESLQVDHQTVNDAEASQGVGIKVASRARRGDHVYRIHPPSL